VIGKISLKRGIQMKEKNKNDQGLPEIAQGSRKKIPFAYVVMGIVLLLFNLMYFYTTVHQKKEMAAIEETYAIKTAPIKEVAPTTKETISAASEQKPLSSEQIAFIQQKQKELQERLNAPLMIVNNRSTVSTNTENTVPTSKDPNTQFLNKVAAQSFSTSTATTIAPLNSIIAQGRLIHAVLEPATNSDLPGSLRAVVSVPVYSEDGSQILIPVGSRLNGEYKSAMLEGQSRIFSVWTRLTTPSGISIALGSPGVDNLGVAGMGADEIDRHFWQRFGTAILLSTIGISAANVGVTNETQDNSASQYRSAIAENFAESAEQSWQQNSRIPPTLKVHQGKSIIVYVARDLDFQLALKQTKPKINVF